MTRAREHGLLAQDRQARRKRRSTRASPRRRPSSISSELLDRRPVAAVRRPAPARRHGPRDRAQAATCSCSTSRSPTSTPSCARRCAPRSSSCTRSVHSTVDLRHARPGRGDDARRPHRHHARRHDRAGRHARRGVPPAGHRFVAGFIGSPPMNLIEATIADGRIVFAGGDWLPLPRQFNAARMSPRRKVVFGLRPDDIYPTGHGLHSGAAAQTCERNAAGLGHRAARQRDAGVRRVRRTRLGVAHAQPDAARARANHRRLSFDCRRRICSTPRAAERCDGG